MSLSDSDDESIPAKTKTRTSATPVSSRPPSRASGVKVKRGVLLSDNDDESVDEAKPKTAKRKGKGRASVAEREEEIDPSIKAMMDIDDCLSTCPFNSLHNVLTPP